jgi:hypothetical protein
MDNNIDEIEGSQLGAALTADFTATPYSLGGLKGFIGDLKRIVSLHKDNPAQNNLTWVMCANSLTHMLVVINKHLPIYINDLKQGKSIEAFEISSGQYRREEFWGLFDKVCDDLRDEPIYQHLKGNGETLKALLAEAEITVNNGDPAIFEKFFFYKKQEFCEFNVMRKFNESLSECPTPSILKLKEMRAMAVADALKSGIFDFAHTPSQREMDEVILDPIIQLLPYNFELTEEFKVAFAKFKRFVKMEGSILKFNYNSYGKYVLTHFYDFAPAQISAIFDLDVMLFLIHQEIERLEPEQEKCLNPTVNVQPQSNQQEPSEEIFHFIHPSLDDDEGWKIHNEVKRLVRRQSVPDIIKYLRNLESENIILLPTVSSVAYDELVRMGMPNTGGFSKEHFRKQYHL